MPANNDRVKQAHTAAIRLSISGNTAACCRCGGTVSGEGMAEQTLAQQLYSDHWRFGRCDRLRLSGLFCHGCQLAVPVYVPSHHPLRSV